MPPWKKRRPVWTLTAGLAVYLVLLVLLVLAERGVSRSNINHLGDAVWWSLVTLTTVGYGDTFPQTWAGRLIGLVFVLASVGMVGLLVSRITGALMADRERSKMGLNGTNFTKHVVIIGWNRLAQLVGQQVAATGVKIAVVTNHKDDIDLIYEQFPAGMAFVLFADFRDVLAWAKAGIKDSLAVFVNLPQDTEKLVCVLNLKKRYESLKYVVALENEDLKETFQTAGVTFTVGRDAVAANIIASYTFEPDVAAFNEDLLSSSRQAGDFDIKQFRLKPGNEYVGRPYLEAFFQAKKQFNTVLIGLAKVQDGQRVLYKNPSDGITLEEGDYLIMVADKEAAEKVAAAFGVGEGITTGS